MEPSRFSAERAQFLPIVEWVGRQRDSGASVDGKIVDLAQRRWIERTRTFSSMECFDE